MANLILAIALMSAFILGNAGIGKADNLMNDPGFELSTLNASFPNSGYWQPAWAPLTGGALCTTTAAHSGSNGLWTYTGNESNAYWSGPYQEFPANAGSGYSAQGWARTPAGWPWVSGSKALLRIQYLDAGHSLIQQFDSNAVTSANSNWQLLSVDTQAAPYGTAYVRFVFYLEKPQILGQSVVNFDDAALSVIVTPQLSVSTGALGFGETATSQTFTINNAGTGELSWSIAKTDDWITVTPTGGSTTSETDSITVSIDRTGLSPGLYGTTLQINSNGGSKTVEVYMEIRSPHSVPDLPSSVFLHDTALYVQRRLPDGSLDFAHPFIVKGAGWSPASIGTASDPFLRQLEFAKWYAVDIPMISRMNANTVYTFIDFGTDATAFSVLDELYNNHIYAIVKVDWDGTNDTDRIQTIVNAYKNHPAVLMWAIGNEWNIRNQATGLYYHKYQTLDQAAEAVQTAALLIKSIDAAHPVTSIYGEIEITPEQPLSKSAQVINTICTAVDVWGLNIYRGDNFGPLFTQWASITTKPMFISEFGADSFFSTGWYPVVGYENESAQKNYLATLWQDIVPELSAADPAKSCLGGTVFEWVDEWWKVRPQDGGSAVSHDSGGFATTWNPTAQPDGFANEEYFGVVKIDRSTKESYQQLQSLFIEPQNQPQVSLDITVAGTGTGIVSTVVPGVACDTTCSAGFDKYTLVTLKARPTEYSIFKGWSADACNGVGDCTLILDTDKTVVADFEPDFSRAVMINNSTPLYFSTISDACRTAATNDFIKIWGVDFTEDLIVDWTLTIKGGFNSDYTHQSGFTVLHGALIIRSGRLVVENLVIR